jgi:hypothetical protein
LKYLENGKKITLVLVTVVKMYKYTDQTTALGMSHMVSYPTTNLIDYLRLFLLHKMSPDKVVEKKSSPHPLILIVGININALIIT